MLNAGKEISLMFDLHPEWHHAIFGNMEPFKLRNNLGNISRKKCNVTPE